jgi:hypothetical protein
MLTGRTPAGQQGEQEFLTRRQGPVCAKQNRAFLEAHLVEDKKWSRE